MTVLKYVPSCALLLFAVVAGWVVSVVWMGTALDSARHRADAAEKTACDLVRGKWSDAAERARIVEQFRKALAGKAACLFRAGGPCGPDCGCGACPCGADCRPRARPVPADPALWNGVLPAPKARPARVDPLANGVMGQGDR